MRAFLPALLAIVMASAVPAQDPAHVTRTYYVPLFLDEVAISQGGGRIDVEQIRAFLAENGISLPRGSLLLYDSEDYIFVLRSTAEIHEAFDELIRGRMPAVILVEIDVSLVSIEAQRIEEHIRRADAAPSGDAVLKLFREGRGRLLASGKVVTRSGVNAQSGGADEIVYPTAFVRPAPRDGADARGVSPLPGGFETREIGLTINVTPTVAPMLKKGIHIIDLTIVPEFTEFRGWDDVDVEAVGPDGRQSRLRVRQPRFFSRNTTTSIALRDGETVVTAAMPNLDQTEISYFLITARLIDAQGRPLRPPRDAKP